MTGSPTQLMQSVDRCKHGVLLSIGCYICKESQSKELSGELCEHGNPIEYTCYDCQEKKASNKYIAQEKEKYQRILNNILPSLREAGVPSKYLNSTFETFTGNVKAIDECRKYNTKSLILSGVTGCGKTHLAVSVLRERLKNDLLGLIEREWAQNRGHCLENSKFTTIPDLLLEIRSSFNGGEKTEQEIIDYYSTINFLVLDDLGSEKTTEFSVTTLYIIIDRRDRELLPTVVTTNLSSQEIEEKIDARIASRLAGWKNIKINMPDYRKKR